MLAYITIGTNNFQRSVDFYDAIFKVSWLLAIACLDRKLGNVGR